VSVNFDQRCRCAASTQGLITADEDAVWALQVLNGLALGQKFRIGENFETSPWTECVKLRSDQYLSRASCGLVAYNVVDESRSPAWDGTLLDDDGTVFGVSCNHADSAFKSGHVCGESSAGADHLRGCVDSQEDQVCLSDRFCAVCGEDQVGLATKALCLIGVSVVLRLETCRSRQAWSTQAVSWNTNNVVKTWLVDWQVSRIPPPDAEFITVTDCDVDRWIVEGSHRSTRGA